MRKSIFILCAVVLLSMLPACFYSDSEMYNVEPVPGDPPVILVTTNLDTLYNPPVNDSLEVIYYVEIEGGELYYVYAVIANTPVFESDSTYGSFWINPNLVDEPGVDTLHIDFYYSSNSNSLADLVGYEALVDSLKVAVDFNMEDAK
ncbi:MAG: hypothetical protein K8R52_05180 [Bacteroidales bacterium]|nr:hypothetical protein [Bacteroidales bacterium]